EQSTKLRGTSRAVKLAGRFIAADPGKLSEQCRISGHSLDSGGEQSRTFGGDEVAILLVIDHFRHASEVCGDHGSAAAQGLHHGHAKGLMMGRKNEQVGIAEVFENLFFRYRAKQPDKSLQAKFFNQSIEDPAKPAAANIVLAGDIKTSVDSPLSQDRNRL